MNRFLAVGAAVACAVGLAACGSSNTTTPSAPPPLPPSPANVALEICPKLSTVMTTSLAGPPDAAKLAAAKTEVESLKAKAPAQLQSSVQLLVGAIAETQTAIGGDTAIAQNLLATAKTEILTICAAEGAPIK